MLIGRLIPFSHTKTTQNSHISCCSIIILCIYSRNANSTTEPTSPKRQYFSLMLEAKYIEYLGLVLRPPFTLSLKKLNFLLQLLELGVIFVHQKLRIFYIFSANLWVKLIGLCCRIILHLLILFFFLVESIDIYCFILQNHSASIYFKCIVLYIYTG